MSRSAKATWRQLNKQVVDGAVRPALDDVEADDVGARPRRARWRARQACRGGQAARRAAGRPCAPACRERCCGRVAGRWQGQTPVRPPRLRAPDPTADARGAACPRSPARRWLTSRGCPGWRLTTANSTAWPRSSRSSSKAVDKISEVGDVEGVTPMTHAVPIENVTRPDVVVPRLDRDAVLAGAPLPRTAASAFRGSWTRSMSDVTRLDRGETARAIAAKDDQRRRGHAGPPRPHRQG